MILRWRLQCREMLHEQTMDEDVSTANLAQKDMLGAVVEEGDEVQRQRAAAPEDAAEGEMLNDREAAVDQPGASAASTACWLAMSSWLSIPRCLPSRRSPHPRGRSVPVVALPCQGIAPRTVVDSRNAIPGRAQRTTMRCGSKNRMAPVPSAYWHATLDAHFRTEQSVVTTSLRC